MLLVVDVLYFSYTLLLYDRGVSELIKDLRKDYLSLKIHSKLRYYLTLYISPNSINLNNLTHWNYEGSPRTTSKLEN